MKNRQKLLLLSAAALTAMVLSACVGSAGGPALVVRALAGLFGESAQPGAAPPGVAILWQIRLPRVLCAFVVGAALSASGAVMQAVLRNPLASSYTLGVSSGASLGAALVIVTGFCLPFAGPLTLPLSGFVFGLGTVLGAMALSARVDRGLGSQTVILMGMVLSLFVNALLTLLSALSRGQMQQLLLWQMGSFSGRSWQQLLILALIALAGGAALLAFSNELDLFTFGEEQAQAVGVETGRARWALVLLAALLTGSCVSFTGCIGFVDLIAPHLARRLFGPDHRVLLPASALLGGGFMVAADTLARTLLAPVELPVGAVTALAGAPFFAWVYFKKGADR